MAKLLCLTIFVITLLFFTTAKCRKIDISKTCEDKELCEVTFSDRGEYLSSIINNKTQKLQFDRLSNSTTNVYHFRILETITVQFKTDNIQPCTFITNLTTSITMYYGSVCKYIIFDFLKLSSGNSLQLCYHISRPWVSGQGTVPGDTFYLIQISVTEKK